MRDTRKPKVIGDYLNVSAVNIDGTFFFNDGPVGAFGAIYLNGYALPPPITDFADIIEFVAASVPADGYITCASESAARFGYPVNGVVTADLKGASPGEGAYFPPSTHPSKPETLSDNPRKPHPERED